MAQISLFTLPRVIIRIKCKDSSRVDTEGNPRRLLDYLQSTLQECLFTK